MLYVLNAVDSDGNQIDLEGYKLFQSGTSNSFLEDDLIEKYHNVAQISEKSISIYKFNIIYTDGKKATAHLLNYIGNSKGKPAITNITDDTISINDYASLFFIKIK